MGAANLKEEIEKVKAEISKLQREGKLEKVAELQSLKSYIDDIDSSVVKKATETGRYKASSNPTDIGHVEVAIIAVPTPLNSGREPDLSFLHSACDLLALELKSGTLIINESTSYPGTLRDVIAVRIENKSNLKGMHSYAISPERVDPGNPNYTIKNTPRLIAGLTPGSAEASCRLYESISENVIVVSSPEIAEAAKVFENSFRQVNIALVNEFATIMHSMGIPTREVLDASSSKPYGFMKFAPGIGVGGHCIPVDPIYLAYISEKFGVKSNFINLATKVNALMPKVVVEMIEGIVGESLRGKKVLVLGISYKPDIADIRESPSIELINILREKGCEVAWNDPQVHNWEGELSTPIPTNGFDLTLIAVAHSKFQMEKVIKSSKIVIDATGKFPDIKQLF